MARCYHFSAKKDCRPNEYKTSNDHADYRTIDSKFNGTCAGCNAFYDKGERIAYFGTPGQSSGSSKTSATSSGSEDALLRALADVQFRLRKAEQQLSQLENLKIMLHAVDFKQLPMREKATTKDVIDIFSGEEVAF